MKKLLILLVLLIPTTNAMAWSCDKGCPTNPLSGKYECLAWKKVKCKDHSKELWGKAGRVAMPAAEKTMKARNKRKEPLTDRHKYALRPIFGDLVDRINVRYSSKMLDKWSALGKEINLSGVDTVGQAYGYDVFVAYPKSRFNSEPADMLHLLIHEITHVQQMRDIKNTVADFGYRYFWEYKAANLNYENNKLEKAADTNANKHWKSAFNRYRGFNNVSTFTKNGNNGTVSCNVFCSNPKFGNKVGTCSSAYNTKTRKKASCRSVPGFLGGPQLTCKCKNDAKVRPGNNGTINCNSFCGRSNEQCIAAFNQKSGKGVSCNTTPGYLDGKHLLCSCVR